MKYMSDFIIYLYTMKVKKLIEKLSKLDWDMEVYIDDTEYWPWRFDYLRKWIKAEFEGNSYTLLYSYDLKDLVWNRKFWLDRGKPIVSEKNIVILSKFCLEDKSDLFI
jgi:hypothetical protein